MTARKARPSPARHTATPTSAPPTRARLAPRRHMEAHPARARGEATADELDERDGGGLEGGVEVVVEIDRRPLAHVPHSARMPRPARPDVPQQRAGTTVAGRPPARRKDRAWISLDDVADLPYGRDRWIRWDQELTSTCPECGQAWADHPGGIQLRAQDGHLGRVLRECPQESGGAQDQLGPASGPLRLRNAGIGSAGLGGRLMPAPVIRTPGRRASRAWWHARPVTAPTAG
jgi:hypothetical protein